MVLFIPKGPVHKYEVILSGPPVRVSDDPAQTGLLLEAVGTDGEGFTIICKEDDFTQLFDVVAVKLYVPDISTDASVATTGL